MDGDFDPGALAGNSFTLEWPRGSGRIQSFPEVDRVRWFAIEEAEKTILPSQLPLLQALRALIGG